MTKKKRMVRPIGARGLLFLVLVSVVRSQEAPAMRRYDVVLRGGTVYDGSGNPPVRADVAIADHATFEQPHQFSTGVLDVLVNGTFVIKDGAHTGATPGRVLRGRGWTGARSVVSD